jgi:hypothetical protein
VEELTSVEIGGGLYFDELGVTDDDETPGVEGGV